MARTWRISSFNGALLVSYFIPAWTITVLKIWESPIRGLYDRANIGPAIFVSDYLQLQPLGTIRFAWLLALGKLTVVAFMMVFLALIVRRAMRQRGVGDEALAIALILGSLISFVSMMLASQVGEVAALRLHATESLLLLSASILLLVEPPIENAVTPRPDAAPAGSGSYVLSSPSS